MVKTAQIRQMGLQEHHVLIIRCMEMSHALFVETISCDATKSKECGGRAAGTVCALAGGQSFVFRWSLCVSYKDLLAKDSA